MQTIQVFIRRLSYSRCLFFFVVLLSGCGGGGDDSPAAPPRLCNCTSVGVVANFSGGGGDLGSPLKYTDFAHFTWQQLEGSPVDLVGNGSAAISFDALASGNYRFQFSALSDDGEALSETFTIAVAEHSGGVQVQLRADRAVSEGAEFSLRLDTQHFEDNIPPGTPRTAILGQTAAHVKQGWSHAKKIVFALF